MRFLPNVLTAFGAVLLTFSLPLATQAQFRTPDVDGSADVTEYGNEYISGSEFFTRLKWRMTWNNTNLFVAIEDANLSEGAVLYLDTDPQPVVNGSGNGTLRGFDYDNTNGALPFAADVVMYVKNSYREYRIFNRETGAWGAAQPMFGTYDDNGRTDRDGVREFSIPWSSINPESGRPQNFNWFGYVSYLSGYYGQVPTANPASTLGNNVNFIRYFTVLNTAAGSNSRAFGPNGLDSYTHIGESISGFGKIEVYDFTLNSPNRSITRNNDVNSTWTIRGNLQVASNSVLNLGASVADVTVAGNVNALDEAQFSFTNPSGGSLTVNGNISFDDPARSTVNVPVALVGNGNQTITGDTYSRLTIDGTGVKTLTGGNLAIGTALVLNRGTLVTGPLLVDLGDTGSLTETNGYLLGNIQAIANVNSPTIRIPFRGLGLALTPQTNTDLLGTVTVQRVTGGFGVDGSTADPTANKTIRRRFFINAPGRNTVANTRIEFTYRGANPNELEGNTATNLKLYKSGSRTGLYSPVTGGSTQIAGTTLAYTGSVLFDAAYFSLSDGTQPLPVELISFTGKAENNAARLSWATASELHNKGFDIEHRTDLDEWKNIGFVAGNGTTNQRSNYTYVDRSTAAGNNYYRLRQIDLDGKSVYTQPVTVQIGAIAFTLSPVPATDVLTLNGLGTGKHTTEIYNVRGQRVLSQTFSDEAATTLTVSTLPAGVYMVRVFGPDRSVRQVRFIKQ